MSEVATEVVAESVPEAGLDVSDVSIAGLRKMLGGAEAGAMVPEEQEEKTETTPAPVKAKAEGETAPAAEPDDIQGTEPEKKAQRGINKRFSDLTGEIRDLKAKLANQQTAAEVKPGVAIPPAVDASEPQSANFETYEAYVKALTKFEIAQAGKATEAKTAQKTMAESWNTRVAEAKAEIPDYAGEADIPISQVMNAAILEHPKGAYIADYLGKNPDEAARIAALPPVSAAVAIGTIAAGLKPAPETKKAAPVVKALPKPPAVVGGSSTPAAKDLGDLAEMSAFKAEARKQLKRPTF